MGTMTERKPLAQPQADSTRKLLEELWAAIDDGEEYEGQPALEYLDELPLEVVWETGEPFAVVLGTGGPHVEITGGGREGACNLHVYWGGEEGRQSTTTTSKPSALAWTRTGDERRS